MTEHQPHHVKVTNKRIIDDQPAESPAHDAAEHTVAASTDEAEAESVAFDLSSARAEAAQHLDDLRRVQAEFENYRKRIIKEQTALAERASSAVIERILPVLDDFELALMAADRTKDYESMVRGVELVYSKLREVLEKEGLERIEAIDAPFDPALHEAVMHAEGEGDELVVVDEMRPGYRLGGRVLRPAMVKVGRRNANA